jgi:MFS family permease
MASGKFATRNLVLRLLGVGLLILAVALAVFPSISGLAGARWYAAGIGLSGGVVTVVFFAAWGNLFGRAQLGRIQGAAQFATVLASSFGPLLAAESLAQAGSYTPFFYVMAVMVGILALAAFVVPLPQAHAAATPALDPAATGL